MMIKLNSKTQTTNQTDAKMGTWELEQTVLQRYTNGHKAHEKMLNMSNF